MWSEKTSKLEKSPKEVQKEVSLESERGIEGIEKSRILETDQKLDLASFILLKEKKVVYPGNHKIIESKEEEKKIKEKFSKEIEEIKKFFELLGFSYSIVNDLKTEENIVGFNMVASKTKEDLEEFIKAREKGEDKVMGLLLGYPKTAVESYGTEESLNFEKFFAQKLSEEEQKKLEEEEVLKFLYFQPSKKHWQKELNEVRKLQSLIKEKLPILYQEIIKSETIYSAEYQKKVAKLEQIKQRTERCVDKLGEPIDEKIKDTVIFLTAFEINTTNSCEGHLDKGTGGPYIDIESKDIPELEKKIEEVKGNEVEEEKTTKEIERKNLEEREKIMTLLEEFYKDRKVSYDRHLIINPMARNWSRIESQGIDFQEIRTGDIKKEKLSEYQKEMSDFTKFLSDRYFGK
jgi:hypothetical protein